MRKSGDQTQKIISNQFIQVLTVNKSWILHWNTTIPQWIMHLWSFFFVKRQPYKYYDIVNFYYIVSCVLYDFVSICVYLWLLIFIGFSRYYVLWTFVNSCCSVCFRLYVACWFVCLSCWYAFYWIFVASCFFHYVFLYLSMHLYRIIVCELLNCVHVYSEQWQHSRSINSGLPGDKWDYTVDIFASIFELFSPLCKWKNPWMVLF